jgi:hypothetical protein
LNLNLENLPTPDSLNLLGRGGRHSSKEQIFQRHKSSKIFSQLPSAWSTDIDGWRGREHILYLFTNNDTELHPLETSSSWGNFSLFFCPNLRGAFCLRFSRKMAVFALFCVGQSGADAQLG